MEDKDGPEFSVNSYTTYADYWTVHTLCKCTCTCFCTIEYFDAIK